MSDNVERPSADSLGLAREIRDALRVAVQMTRILDYPGELSTPQVTVLNTLAVHPSRIGDLARLGGVTQPGMSQLVSRLENSGLARRTRDAEDARATLVEITEEGRSVLDRVNTERNTVLGVHLERLTAQDVQRIRDGLGPLSRLAADVVEDSTTTDEHIRRR